MIGNYLNSLLYLQPLILNVVIMTNSETPEGLSYEYYENIEANPYNPRELFDRPELDVLKDSIRHVGILVPLLVYRRKKDGKIVIMDGERRWRCVSELVKEYPSEKRKWEKIPLNIIPEPDMVSNILRMFNIHNVRQPWELMPTALKLGILMEKLNERNDEKISKLTGLSTSNVRRCKILLDYDKEFQDEMMHLESSKRIRADFFIELYPMLSLIKKNFPNITKKFQRIDLIRIFLKKYKNNEITSVLDFRDLADLIRSMKRGSITLEECEGIFFNLLEEKTELKDIVTKTYHPTKLVETLQKSIQSTIDDIINFEPVTVSDRDKIQKILQEALDQIKKKMIELEEFESKE